MNITNFLTNDAAVAQNIIQNREAQFSLRGNSVSWTLVSCDGSDVLCESFLRGGLFPWGFSRVVKVGSFIPQILLCKLIVYTNMVFY